MNQFIKELTILGLQEKLKGYKKPDIAMNYLKQATDELRFLGYDVCLCDDQICFYTNSVNKIIPKLILDYFRLKKKRIRSIYGDFNVYINM